MWNLYHKPGMFKVSNIFCWIKTSYELANISLYFCINFGDLKLIFQNIDFQQNKSKIFIELKYVCWWNFETFRKVFKSWEYNYYMYNLFYYFILFQPILLCVVSFPLDLVSYNDKVWKFILWNSLKSCFIHQLFH